MRILALYTVLSDLTETAKYRRNFTAQKEKERSKIMAFVILCDRCGAIIRPGKSSYASVSCTMNGKMDAFLICECCYDDLTHWITGNDTEDDE